MIVGGAALCACSSSQNPDTSVNDSPSTRPSEANWVYTQREDEITKSTTSFAHARLSSDDLEGAYSDVSWSCPGAKIESLAVEIDTYHRDDKPLAQDPSKDIEYRFDGVVHHKGGKREYSNSTTLTVPESAIWASQHNPYGRRVTTHIDHPYTMNASVKYVSFAISDPEFALRIRVDGGDLTLKFSLEEAAIKKVLTECGFDYAVPSKSVAANGGLDLDIPNGTPVTAAAAGIVTWAGERTGYGLSV